MDLSQVCVDTALASACIGSHSSGSMKVLCPIGEKTFMLREDGSGTIRRRSCRMCVPCSCLIAGKDLANVPQAREISDATLDRWPGYYGGTKSDEPKRLKAFEEVRRLRTQATL